MTDLAPERIKKTIYINIGKDDIYVEAFTTKKAADYWANIRPTKPVARLKIEIEYTEGGELRCLMIL
jgi:hypothetical protein